MPMRLNDVNGDASEAAFGFKATSSSTRPVHLSQVIFSNVLGSTHQSEDLFNFVERPGKSPSSELDDKYHDLFESSRDLTDEQLDNLRNRMRKILDNDNALYASTPHRSAMTSMSDWFIIPNHRCLSLPLHLLRNGSLQQRYPAKSYRPTPGSPRRDLPPLPATG